MIRPDEKVVKALAMTVRQYPEILEFLGEWRTRELEQLPRVLTNTAVSQGRCQVLSELFKLASDAPDHAAKSGQRQPSNNAHQ